MVQSVRIFRSFFIALALSLMSSVVLAESPCNELLSARLGRLIELESRPAKNTVPMTHTMLYGEGMAWLLGGTNPWARYEGQCVQVAIPIDGAMQPCDEKFRTTQQTLTGLEDFQDMFPEVAHDFSEVIERTLETGHEWGFFVFAVKDEHGVVRLFANARAFTSNDSTQILSRELSRGAEKLTKEIQRQIPDGAQPWVVTEAWLVHSHPRTFSPLSDRDALGHEYFFETLFKKSLRFRMIAVTTADSTVFSMSREAETSSPTYVIDKAKGWVVR
jgi:hypothetical protein